MTSSPCGMLECFANKAESTDSGIAVDIPNKDKNVLDDDTLVDETTDTGIGEIDSVIRSPSSGGGLTQLSVKSHGAKPANGEALQGFENELSENAAPKRNRNPIFPLWSQFTSIFHSMIQSFVVSVAVASARRPKITILSVTMISFGLLAAGWFTNFNINTDEQEIYAPFKSRTKTHSEWINNESGFPGNARVFTVSLHADGDNVLGSDYIRQVFQVVDSVRAIEGYDHVCSQGDYVNFDGDVTCKIASVSRFFKHDIDVFEEVYEEGGEEAITKVISADTYENLTPVDTDMILGNYVDDPDTGLIESVDSYLVFFFLANKDKEGLEKLEGLMMDKMAQMQVEWDNDASPLKLEYFAMRSYSDEFQRAIEKDLYLLPIVFFLMSGFTCLVFFRCDRVQSRSLLGIGSVVTILLAIMSSFGILFMIGVPFTSMTQILPFVVFGVGLDDAFIITGAYFRTDPDKEPEERIREAMEEVGLSISVTTITTMVAFMLGLLSTIPAIYWLNLYAFPTIAVDFLFQITFFVALIVLDERRIQANRMDCCTCITSKKVSEDWESDIAAPNQTRTRKTVSERFMAWYARKLLRPWVKFVVVVLFLGYAGFCSYTTTKLTQEFDFADLLPADSYVKDFLYSIETYTTRVLGVGIYFRGDHDQMDPDMQRQMKNYVDELSALPQFIDDPPFCWFRDFEEFMNSSLAKGVGLENMTYTEQLDYAFSVPAIKETYGKHVVRNESGAITASRCFTYAENVDLKVVKDQIGILQAQREVTARQPINQGTKDWSFFTFDRVYFIWEFYAVAVEELIYTTISGVAAVCAVGFLFFPHWTGIFFVGPLIAMLYINLLGTLQWAGLHINAVTYICLVISIGLMVDFIVHVLLRYYESSKRTREDRVRDTLETMGASILVGGLSTSLGVLPLALSTSNILSTVFISFFAMIALGVTHGLVFLPVLLSICGPTGTMDSVDIIEEGDLVLKPQSGSDTDQSDDDSDKTTGFNVKAQSSYNSEPSHHEVLHSSRTMREESLEVVQWSTTMAWI
ncbi:Pick type protein homolog 1B [Seminavis robusta]|uniref:Pick type protein homolog 1B n=1 Tax=Seminavis robusta TaxID=568900 RepID=A0A9N8EVG9_9STRA|nr:Pick type protein homolog 1B [Seminavis robusta]|eukprot:Sro1807_g298960.1 Pick type protein homolog 1B (1030) ;mRNA; r:12927-16619